MSGIIKILESLNKKFKKRWEISAVATTTEKE
jgi:hypothetical protein